MYTVRIKSIKSVGRGMTYDLKVQPHHNFYLSNGILTHNSGKSWLAMQIGKYVDPTLDLSRIVFNPVDFRDAVMKAKKGQCIIYDEAFTGFSSRSSLSGVNKVLVSLAMQMRQNNLFVIIVLPTIFLLDKYLAMFRTKILIHVYENKGIRGYFRVYSYKLKKYLLLDGAKTYSYRVRTKFKGRFYGVFGLGDDKMEKKYREKKAKALKETETSPMTAGQVKYKQQRDLFLFLLRKQTGFTYEQIANLISDFDVEMTFVQIRNICVQFGDKEDKKGDKTPNSAMKEGEKGVKSLEKELKEVKTPEMVENDDLEPFDREKAQKEGLKVLKMGKSEVKEEEIDEKELKSAENDDFEDNFDENDDFE